MRCLALADALRERRTQTRFLSRHLPEHLRNKLAEKGHEFAQLDTFQNGTAPDELAHATWLGVSQLQDAAASIQALSDQHWDWLIIDHYAMDTRWESLLRHSADKILAIDDIADRQHDCDILLDQNLYADMETRYTGKAPAHCQLLLGPSYALLRDEFRYLHGQINPRNGPVKRVLVFFGGVDADNYTGQAIEVLAQMDVSDLHVDVVIGAQHPSRKQIQTECTRYGFDCHVQTDKMAELMAMADLAIGAGGSACWERCSLGLPALLVAVANNQVNIAKALDLYGACIYVGTYKTASTSIMRSAVVTVLNNQALTERLSRKAYSLVDGLGVSRVCKEMGC